MRLRGKILLIVGLMWAGLVLVGLLTSRAIVLGGFEEQEEQDTLQHIQRVLAALDRELEGLDRTTLDWASWDDAYRFIEDGNPAFQETNLVDEVFPTLQLSLMLFVHRSGAIVFGQAYDLEADEPQPLPSQLKEDLAQGLLLNHQEPSSRITGLLMLPEGPLLVASRPILTSEGQGPIRGTLVFGRLLDATQVQELAETTLLTLSSHMVADAEMPPDVRETLAALEDQGTPVAARPLDAATIAGYALVRDLEGAPALVLKAEAPREVYARGRTTVLYLMGVLLSTGLMFSLLMVVLIEKMVLSPLARLGATVNRIHTSGELSQRVPIQGRDELALLAQDFNAMLERLERSQAELKRSNQDLEQLASVASHDLQEPLRMVASYTQLLQRRYQGRLDSDADQFIAFAVDGATRMQHLITDLLAYARAGASGQERRPTDCAVVLRSALANLETAVTESHATITHDPLPTVMADPRQLGQVFQNLLGNALKYRDPQRVPQVHIGARLTEGQWLLSVRDNGIGIEGQHLDRLFGLFQRLHTREEYPGAGIGLALCKRIVERHGGRIWVESQPGVGSTFFFTLPTRDGSL